MSLPPLPAIGLGCSPLVGASPRQRPLADTVREAYDLGYRLFDTAEAYGTERAVGGALAGRADVVLVSKLWHTNHAPEHVLAACEGSCRRLGVPALDLFLVHAPQAWRHVGPLDVPAGASREVLEHRLVPRAAHGGPATADVPLADTWAAMLEARRRGLARAVGFANADEGTLLALAAAGLEPPAAVQVEVHPLAPRGALREHCRRAGIALLAQSPFGSGAVLADAGVRAAAAMAQCAPAALVLAWLRHHGVVPLPASDRPDHLRANLAAASRESPTAGALAALDSLTSAAAPS